MWIAPWYSDRHIEPCKLQQILDEAVGSFSFVSRGVRLTYDFRKIYNRLILAREWK